MRSSKSKSIRGRLNLALTIAFGLFVLAELIAWGLRKPPISGVAPSEPGGALASFELKPAPAPAKPGVRVGASVPVELGAGDRIAFWTRVEPMTPELPAQLGAVTLAVRVNNVATEIVGARGVCSMHKPGGSAWTELCGADKSAVCLRTATDCSLVAPAAGQYIVEASVEWFEGAPVPTAAAIESFVHRAP